MGAFATAVLMKNPNTSTSPMTILDAIVNL